MQFARVMRNPTSYLRLRKLYCTVYRVALLIMSFVMAIRKYDPTSLKDLRRVIIVAQIAAGLKILRTLCSSNSRLHRTPKFNHVAITLLLLHDRTLFLQISHP